MIENKNTGYKNWVKKMRWFALIGITIGLQSCEKDLLDTAPKTQVLTNNMWLTENLTDQGVNGVYAAMRLGQPLYRYDAYVTLQGRDNSALMNGTMTSSNGMFSNTWKELFEGVHRANDALNGLTNISPTEEKKKARLVAEVRFLRAYYYYRLNQLYKGVPIYLEPIVWDEINLPRSSEQEVWKLVIDELTSSIQEENLPDRYNSGDANFGRITKSAAYALRGKVYLYTKEWQKAIDDFEQVKNMGHSLFSDYEKLFKDENEQSSEIIFSIQNMPLSGYGSDYHFRFGSRSAFGSNWNTYLVHPDAVDRYQTKDGQAFNWDNYIPGFSQMSLADREVFFFRNQLTASEIENMEKRGVNMAPYLPNGNEERILKAYENRDPRLAASVILPYSTYLGANGVVDQEFTSRWPFRNEFSGIFDLRTDITAKFYYYPRKFVYTGATPNIPNREAGGYDYIVIRYADVLLSWAEALNELGNTTGALDKVNEVRARAGVNPVSASLGQIALTDEIRDERRREFIAEGVIYFDELRWKTLEKTSFAQGNGIKEVWGAVTSPYSWGGERMYIWAIPQVERERNTSLTQNPGWDD